MYWLVQFTHKRATTSAGNTTAVAVKAMTLKKTNSKTDSTKKTEHPTYREMISFALGAMKE